MRRNCLVQQLCPIPARQVSRRIGPLNALPLPLLPQYLLLPMQNFLASHYHYSCRQLLLLDAGVVGVAAVADVVCLVVGVGVDVVCSVVGGVVWFGVVVDVVRSVAVVVAAAVALLHL